MRARLRFRRKIGSGQAGAGYRPNWQSRVPSTNLQRRPAPGICTAVDADCYPHCYPKHKGPHQLRCNPLFLLARPERFELPTARFVAEYSIQLSYGRIVFSPAWRAPTNSGGEGGIRTLEGLLTLTPLAGERFRPLSHLSEMFDSSLSYVLKEGLTRRFAPRPFGARVDSGLMPLALRALSLRSSVQNCLQQFCRPLSHLSGSSAPALQTEGAHSTYRITSGKPQMNSYFAYSAASLPAPDSAAFSAWIRS